jgi:CheY-like chemotaxis protein
MSQFRILVVDDEPDIRKVVALSLARDPELVVRTSASGQAGLEEAAEWLPDLILLDFMMPVLDGPATLARLRQNPSTATIPVVFLTARARTEELDRIIMLGASGAIAKPFEPKALRQAVRHYLSSAPASPSVADPRVLEGPLAAEQDQYRLRLKSDAAKLCAMRAKLEAATCLPADFGELRTVVHKLAGSAGIYGFNGVSHSASELEKTIVATSAGDAQQADIVTGLNNLLDGIAHA